MTETHWKKLMNKTYLGSWDLDGDGKDLIVEIVSAGNEKVKNRDGKEDNCMVVYLKGLKPFVVNITNGESIEKVTGTPYVEKWKGHKLSLYIQPVRAFGQTVDAIRVRNKPPTPKALPELTPEHESWATVKAAIDSGKYTVDAYREMFSITKSNEQLLCQK
jgi:hypothetical protein